MTPAAINWSGWGLRIRRILCGLWGGVAASAGGGSALLRAPPDPHRSLHATVSRRCRLPHAAGRQAEPAPGCCRSAVPTATCCRRIEHDPGSHRLKLPGSSVFRNSPKNSCRRCLCEPHRPLHGHKALLKGELSLSKKVLTSWWTGKQAPPPLPPSPVFAEI